MVLAAFPCERHAARVSDADLRELERRWRETGCVDDEAAWLRARVQARELGEQRLELAAYLGHPAARAAQGVESTTSPADMSAEDFARGIVSFEREVGVRAALAAVSRLAGGRTSLPTHVQACFAEVEGWLLKPGEERAVAAFRAGQQVASRYAKDFNAYRLFAWTPCGIEAAARLLGWPRDSEREEPVVPCLTECGRALGAEAIQAVREALIPWALGES